MADRCLYNVTQDHSATTGVETHEAGEAGSSALNQSLQGSSTWRESNHRKTSSFLGHAENTSCKIQILRRYWGYFHSQAVLDRRSSDARATYGSIARMIKCVVRTSKASYRYHRMLIRYIRFFMSSTIVSNSSIEHNSTNCKREKPHELNIVLSACRATLCTHTTSIALVLLRSLQCLEATHTIRQLNTVIGMASSLQLPHCWKGFCDVS
jgi:hypothetical protein